MNTPIRVYATTEEKEEHEAYLAGPWGDLGTYRDRRHADNMHDLECYGGTMTAAAHDGDAGTPNRWFCRPYYKNRDTYLYVYAVRHAMRKGHTLEEFPALYEQRRYP